MEKVGKREKMAWDAASVGTREECVVDQERSFGDTQQAFSAEK